MVNQKKFLYILFLFLSISLINSQDFKEIKLENGTKILPSQSQSDPLKPLKYKVLGIKDYPYLSIRVSGEEKKIINHVISYYQNEEFNERKQLSQSLTSNTIMWLSKKQIEEDFYLTVECAKIPCQSTIYFDGKKSAELYANQQYTYYVTEQNKEMSFTLLCDIEDFDINNTYITIWTRGNYDIDANLIGGESESYANNRYYRIKYRQFMNSTYILNVNGKVGDLINVGASLFPEYVDNGVLPNFTLQDGEEITGYVYNRLINLFKIQENEKPLGYYYDFNNQINRENFKFYDNKYILETQENEEYFFSLQHIKTTEYDGQGNNKYSPLLDGIYYLKKIEKGTTIGLIPMKPEDNFNYLTYEVFPFIGDMRAFIYECDNYPLCHIDEKAIDESKEIYGFQNFYEKFTKDDWKNISPISKNQKMLLIHCVTGINDEYCISSVNMKTDTKYINSTDFFKEFPPNPRFLPKNDKDKYFLKGNNNPKLLFIELFSGSVDVEIEPNIELVNIANKSNYYLYSLPENKDYKITVTAEENAVYMINDNSNIINNKILYIGSNSLFNLEKGKTIEFDIKDILPMQNINGTYYYFVGMYTWECPIKITTTILDDNTREPIEKELSKKNPFFEYLVNSGDQSNIKVSLINDKNNNNCLFYITTYEYELIYPYADGIPLKNNTYQLFRVGTDVNSTLLLSYPITELNDNIYFIFMLFEKEKNKQTYDVNLIFNNQNEIKHYNISNKENITLNSDEIKDYCKDFKSICKILLEVHSEITDSTEFKIFTLSNKTFNVELEEDEIYNDKKEDDDDDDNKTLIIILSAGGGVLLIIIIIVIICLVFKYKKGDLSNKVNTISFQNDKNEDDEENGETLLE